MLKTIVTCVIAITILLVNSSQVGALVPCPANEPNCKDSTYINSADNIYVPEDESKFNLILPAALVFTSTIIGIVSYVVYKKRHIK